MSNKDSTDENSPQLIINMSLQQILQAVYNNGLMSNWKLSETKAEDMLNWLTVDQTVNIINDRYILKSQVEKEIAVHFRHCNKGEYKNSCKYGEYLDCPSIKVSNIKP